MFWTHLGLLNSLEILIPLDLAKDLSLLSGILFILERVLFLLSPS
jgi:hypothetical protein